MTKLNRRSALQTLGMSALAAAVARMGSAAPSTQTADADLASWLDQLYANAARLRHRQISGLQWQEVMDQLYGHVPLPELYDRLDFGNLKRAILDTIPSDRGELFQTISLPGSGTQSTIDGREPHRVLLTKMAHVKKGRSIPPHGHSNMASAFLCLSGEFQVRQYDRLEDQPGHLIVRETVHERRAGVGTWSSISDYRDNVHWLTAQTDDCFLFTSKLINLEEGRPLHGRINIDLHRAEVLGSRTFRAPKITSAEAMELY